MGKKTLTLVEREECLAIRNLFARKNAVLELSKNIWNADNQLLYEKVLADLVQTEEKISSWWSITGLKYNFSPSTGLSIDFNTGEIYIAFDNKSTDYNVF